MSLFRKKQYSGSGAVSGMMHQQMTAIAQNLMLHKTWQYFSEKCNENTNKKAKENILTLQH